MNITTLFSLLKLRGIKPAGLARLAGVSRQAVSAWKRKASAPGAANIDVMSKTQDRIAEALGVRSDDLNREIPILAETRLRKMTETELLWDKSFPNLESFTVAAVKGNRDALARLVQTYGLYGAAKIAGDQVWRNFPKYKMKIHPAVRKQAEIVWTLKQNQT